MKLDPNEHAVMGFFRNEDAATKALAQLKEEGFKDIQLAFIGHTPDVSLDRVGLGESSAADAVLDGGRLLNEDDAGPAMAAMPSVSGMSGHMEPASPQFLITAVVPNHVVPHVVRLLQSHGGLV